MTKACAREDQFEERGPQADRIARLHHEGSAYERIVHVRARACSCVLCCAVLCCACACACACCVCQAGAEFCVAITEKPSACARVRASARGESLCDGRLQQLYCSLVPLHVATEGRRSVPV